MLSGDRKGSCFLGWGPAVSPAPSPAAGGLDGGSFLCPGGPRVGGGWGCGGCMLCLGVCWVPTVQPLRMDCTGLLTWVWALRPSYSPGPGGPQDEAAGSHGLAEFPEGSAR